MNSLKRFLPRLLFLGIFIILIIIFRSIIMDYLVGPIASVFWLFWRILTSANQEVYWLFIICIVIILLCCLIPSKSTKVQHIHDGDPEKDVPANSFESWHSLITNASTDNLAHNSLRRSVQDLLVNVITHVERTTPLIVHEDLISKKIPLPSNVYLYIYPHEGKRELSLWQWIRKWSSQRSVKNHEELNETLKWIETYLEKKHEI